MKKIFLLPLFALAVLQACTKEVGLLVDTNCGTVEGIELENGVKAFLGIPFAQAPVGELRWKAPQPMTSWEGVREAKSFGNDPMQPRIYSDMIFRGPSFSEDCLYLNVWTNATTAADKLPVLIYFNGGGLMAGSGSELRYDGASISAEGVIGVTANYREGVFGFLAHPELSAETAYEGSGNYGFLDQVAAIKWVKENIEAFGGDPDHITIAGESAGSFSVSVLMASPLSKDMIAGAILSSGAEVMPRQSVALEDAEAAGAALLQSKGLVGIAEARALSAEDLQTLIPPFGMAEVVLDGYLMKESTDSVYANGRQADVPLLAGWNSLEGVPGAPTVEGYKDQLRGYFGDMTDEIFEAYGIMEDADVWSDKGFTLAGDLFTGFPTWKLCDYHARTSSCHVFRYKFNRPRPEKNGNGAPGAVHSADIEYAMGNLATNTSFDWKDEDYAISKIFLGYYVNFCKNGNPNGEGLPEWTPINGNLDAAPVMQIDVETVEVASQQRENAYRTLEKFFINKSS